MPVPDVVGVLYLAIVAVIGAFLIVFVILSRRPPGQAGGSAPEPTSPRMEKHERDWLYFLLAIVVLGNLVTLSPLLLPATEPVFPAQPALSVTVEVRNYTFILPASPVRVPVGQPIEFLVVSHDVTYGFGIFRKDGSMVFQMQVVPLPYVNRIVWVFDAAGTYDLRSTEYSGPLHPTMYVPDALIVEVG